MSAFWKDKRVLVTGAGGYIGSHLVEALLQNGAQVRAFVRYTSRGDPGFLSFVPEQLQGGHIDGRPDIFATGVILYEMLAGKPPFTGKSPGGSSAIEIFHAILYEHPPVLTGGEWAWDAAAGDFTEDSTAVPDALRGVFVEEPLYLDLRWARDDLHLSLRHARFRDAIAQLAAPMPLTSV